MKSFSFHRDTPLAMVVDDEISLRLSMSAALEKMGFEVVEAENGREALTLFEANTPDLVLLDVLMPEMDGFEATEEIRKMEVSTEQHVPIIAMTAHAMKGDR
ncbi:MAG: response regulator, partial [Desulfocapsa sp.]|nr:response regulator [Desulfocapsa sp.]